MRMQCLCNADVMLFMMKSKGVSSWNASEVCVRAELRISLRLPLTTCKISSPQTVSVFFAVVLFFAVFRSIKSRANSAWHALRFTTCFRLTCTQWSLSWMRISCPRRQMWKHILKRFENDEKKRTHIYIFCIILRIVSAWRDFEIRGRTRSAQNRRPTFHNFRANGSKTADAKGQAMTLTSEASRPQSQD